MIPNSGISGFRWFGGTGAQEDWAALTVDFLDASGVVTGSNVVGHVTAAERGGVTAVLRHGAEQNALGGARSDGGGGDSCAGGRRQAARGNDDAREPLPGLFDHCLEALFSLTEDAR